MTSGGPLSLTSNKIKFTETSVHMGRFRRLVNTVRGLFTSMGNVKSSLLWVLMGINFEIRNVFHLLQLFVSSY